MKVIALLSGGIDSPVAACSMARQGCEVVLLHMDNRPYSNPGSVQKVSRLVAQLEEATGRKMTAVSAPHGRNQEIISKSADRHYQCVLCKRLMLRVAKAVAIRLNAQAVVTGESLGQVASQTLHNIRSEQAGLDFLVLRPLIGWDKLEIERLAKNIGTYEISISGESGPACTILPERVVTMAGPEDVGRQEEKLDMDEMVAFAVENMIELRAPGKGNS